MRNPRALSQSSVDSTVRCFHSPRYHRPTSVDLAWRDFSRTERTKRDSPSPQCRPVAERTSFWPRPRYCNGLTCLTIYETSS